MSLENNSKRRWQFSLGALFVVMTVAIFIAAALAGSFGVPIRQFAMNLGVVLLILATGIIFYVLLLLTLGSPILLIFGGLKLVSRVFSRRKDGTQDEPSRTSLEEVGEGD